MKVGVRELRDSLSKHLAEVRAGATVTVTDHGRPVARLVPVGPSKLDLLIAEGRVTPATQQKQPAVRPLRADGTVSDLISEQRQ